MSKMVDERVVEIKFNNRDFERNAKQTLSTLDQLHSGLNFKDQARNLTTLGNASKKISFSVLENGIQKVNAQFSAMQVAGITALTNITNQAVNAGKQLVKSLSIDQVTSGYTKYEEKTASVQTIMSATGKTIEEVSAALEKLNWFTDETSYNFVDMTNNIGKFTSAGVDLDVSVTAMEGIATAAALAGQNASTASRVMYNFSQALGTGAVKLQDWMSIENANMATLEFKQTVIDTATELGVLTKVGNEYKITGTDIAVSAQAFRETLSEGWFNSDVLLKTLEKYGDYSEKVYKVATEQGITCSEAMAQMSEETMTLGERAFRAAQEAKTFTDAIEATKDAVSTGWMTTFETLFGNYVEAKDTWTELANRLYDIFAEGGNVRNELLGDAMGSRVSQFERQLKDAGYSVESFRQQVLTATSKAGIDIQEMFQKYGFYTDEFMQSEELSGIIDNVILGMADDTKKAAVDQSKLNEYLETYNKLLSDVAGKKITDEQAAKTAEKLGISMDTLNDQVDWFIESGYDAVMTFEDLSDEQLKSIGYTKSEIDSLKRLSSGFELTTESAKGLVDSLKKPTGRELLIDALRDALVGLQQVLNIVKNAWAEVFPALTADRIYTIIERFKSFTENLVLNEENADKLQRTFKGIFSILDIGAQIIKAIVQNGFNLLKEVLGLTNVDLLDFTAGLGDTITGFDEFLRRTDGVNQFFINLINLIKTGYGYLKELVNEILQLPQVNSAIQTVKTAFNDFIEFIGIDTTSATKTFDNIVNNFKALNDITFDDVKGAFKEFSEDVADLAPDINIGESLDNATADVKNWGEKTVTQIKDTFKGATDETTGGIENFISAIKETLSKIDLQGIALVALGFGLLLFTNSLIKNINALMKTLTPLNQIVKTLVDTLSGIGKAITKAVKGLTFVTELVGVALTIFLIASSIEKLAEAVSTLNTENSAGAVIGLVAAIAGLTVAALVITKMLANPKNAAAVEALKAYMTAVIGLSAAVVVLSGALKILSSIPWPELLISLGAMAASGLALIGALKLMSLFVEKLNGIQTAKVVGTLLGISSAIALLAGALKLLSSINVEQLFTDLGAAVLSLIAIGVASRIAGTGSGTIGSIVALVGMILAFKILTDAIAKIDVKSLGIIVNNLDFIVAVILTLTLFATKLAKALRETVASLNEAAKFASRVGFMIVEIALAVVILTQSFKSLTKALKDASVDDVVKSGAVMGGLLVIMGGLVAVSKLAGEFSLKAGGMILMVSASVAVLSLIVAGLGRINKETLDKGLGVVASLLGLFVVMLQVSKFEKSTENGYKAIAALATTLGVVLILVAILGTIDETGDKIPQIVISIAGLFLAVGVALKQISDSGKSINYGHLFAQIAILTLVVMGIGTALAIIQTIFNASDVQLSVEMVASIGLIMLTLAETMKVMASIDSSKVNTNSLWNVVLMMSVLSGVALALNAAITAMVNNPNSAYKNGFDIKNLAIVLGSIGVILAEMAGLYFAISKVFKGAHIDKNVLENINSLALIISLLTFLLGGLALIDINISESLSAAAGVGLLLTELGTSAWLLAKLPNKKIVQNARETIEFLMGIMSKLTVMLAIMGIASAAGGNMVSGAAAIGILLTELGVFSLLLAKLPNKKIVQNAKENLNYLIAVMGVLTILIALLATIKGDADAAVTNALVLGGLLTVLVGLTALLMVVSKIKVGKIGAAIGVLVAITVVAGLCAGIIAILGTFADGDESLKLVGALVETMIALAGFGVACIAIGSIMTGPTIAAAAKGLVFFLALLVIVDAVLAGIGALVTKFEALGNAIISGSTFMGEVIGAFFGGIVDAFSRNATQALVDISNAIAVFSENVGSINTDNLGLFYKSIEAINDLAATNTSKLDKKTEQVTNMLTPFGEALCEYSDVISELDQSDIDHIKTSVEAIHEIVKIANELPNSGGLWGAIVGNNDFWTFIGEEDDEHKTGLMKFGESIVKFAGTIKDLNYDEDKMKMVEDVALTLAGIQTAFAKEGGIESWVMGSVQKWDELNEGIPGFGEAVVSFVASVSALEDYQLDKLEHIPSVVNSMAAIIAALKDIDISHLPEVEVFTGEYEEKWDVNTPKYEKVKSVWSVLTGGLQEFANEMIATADIVAGFNETRVKAINTFVQKSSDVANLMQLFMYGTDGTEGQKAVDWDLTTQNIKGLASAMVEFSNTITDISGSKQDASDTYRFINDIVDIFNDEQMSSLAYQNMIGFVGALDTFAQTLKADGEFIKGISSDDYIYAGRQIMKGLAQGMIDELPNVGVAAAEACYTITDTVEGQMEIKSPSKLMARIGKWIPLGLAKGITDNFKILKTTAINTADLYEDTFRDKMGIHSPSDEEIDNGNNIIGGLVEGIQEGWDKLKGQVYGVADNVASALGLDFNKLKDTVVNAVTGTGVSFDTLSGILGINAEAFDLSNFNFDDFGAQLQSLTGNVDSLSASLLGNAAAIDEVKKRINDRSLELETAKQKLSELQAQAEAGAYLDPITGEKVKYSNQALNEQIKYWDNRIKTLEVLINKDKETQAELESNTDTLQDMLNSAKDSLSAFQDEYGSLADEAYNQALTKGNEAVDKLVRSLEKGKISASEFSKAYQEVIEKNKVAATEIKLHAEESMEDFINTVIENAADKLTDSLSDIQDKMQDASDNLSKSYEDVITFETNKDVYDKKVADYNDQLEILNANLRQVQRRYGENSREAQSYQEQIDKLNMELEAYEDYYATAGFDDDQIIAVNFSDMLSKETEELKQFNKDFEKLRSDRNLSDAMVEYIAGLSHDQQVAMVEWLSSLTQDQLDTYEKQLAEHNAEADKFSQSLYGDRINKAVAEYDETITKLRTDLPPEFKSLGEDLVEAMENGFDKETENMLAKIGLTGDKLIEGVIKHYTEGKELDYGDSAAALTNYKAQVDALMTQPIPEETKTNVGIALGVVAGEGEEQPYLVSRFADVKKTLQEDIFNDEFLKPVIRPVLDLTDITTKTSTLDTLFSSFAANKADLTLNGGGSANIAIDTTQFGASKDDGFTFIQNNYSPDPIDEIGVYRAAKSALQLVNVFGWR